MLPFLIQQPRSTGSDFILSLIRNVSKQIRQRAENLPQGMLQRVVIDVRGQKVTVEQERDIVNGIVRRANEIIKADAISFKRK
ncbi:hypothetical protein GCM10027202_16610 [Microvirgula curvata]